MINLITPTIALSAVTIGLLITVVILLGVLVALYFFGRNAEKKQADSQKILQENAQVMSLYVLDKKKLKLKEAGLPSIVYEQAPKYARRAKVPIVKVKVGPKVMNLIADSKVYETILPKMEVKAKVSGIYITSFKRIRGPVYNAAEHKKKHFWQRSK